MQRRTKTPEVRISAMPSNSWGPYNQIGHATSRYTRLSQRVTQFSGCVHERQDVLFQSLLSLDNETVEVVVQQAVKSSQRDEVIL